MSLSYEQNCPKCKGDMEQGIVPVDFFTQAEDFVPSGWLRGSREEKNGKSFWEGDNRIKGIPIKVFRCLKCGYLEFYAVKEDIQKTNKNKKEIF